MNAETLIALEQAMEPYRQAGYTVTSQTESSITLVGQHRSFNYLGFFISLLLFWPAAIIYLISYNHSRDTSVCLRITSQGWIEVSGYTLSVAAKERKQARLTWIIIVGAFLLLGALLILVLIMRAR